VFYFHRSRIITGYLLTEDVPNILRNSPDGTFLLRFSLKTPKAITVDSKTNGIRAHPNPNTYNHTINFALHIACRHSRLHSRQILTLSLSGCIYSIRSTACDLQQRSLPDRILDIPQYKFFYTPYQRNLYPKDEVFGKYVTGEIIGSLKSTS
jgi:hypothetical protein